MKLLILGGTYEARQLALRLKDDARFDATMSLAGRTLNPRAIPISSRVGGFGGVSGLCNWLKFNAIDAMIDATHPYAAQISTNAVEAADALRMPLFSVSRAPWLRHDEDQWIDVSSAVDAALALPRVRNTVLLTVGRLELPAFSAQGNHRFIARTIDPVGMVALPSDILLIQEQGPFTVDSEIGLLKQHCVDILVSKNSGGTHTYAKIVAARALKLPVIMIARPVKPTGAELGSIDDAITWLETLDAGHERPRSRSDRGV